MSQPLVRQRLTREERRKQLIDVAWHIIRQEGTDALTLGYLATQAGVTKPVVYDHFDSRSGLFATLYREYDQRQTARMDEILRNTEPNAEKLASAIANAYIECVLLQGARCPASWPRWPGRQSWRRSNKSASPPLPENVGTIFRRFARVRISARRPFSPCSAPQTGYRPR